MSESLQRWNEYRVKIGERVKLSAVRADSHEFCAHKEEGRRLLKEYRKEIDERLRALAAEGTRSLLVVLQGMDAAGKDGAVRKVFTGVNPQHCKVTSFKEPDREERAHDYLWRVHQALPARGELGVFNRSQYEDVLVGQAHGDLSGKDARVRLRQINDVEAIWSENGTVVRKVFLHISRDEQTRRFQKRLDNPEKHWKVEASDFEDRKLWGKFQKVYEEILERTATKRAPWFVVPADHKWYRDTVVAGVVLGALREMDPQVPRVRIDKKEFEMK